MKENTGHIIHCVLRNIVAHNEELKKGSQNRGYEEIMHYFNQLSFDDIYQGMKKVIAAISVDLREQGIIVNNFAL